jgi:hypothetical protein
MQRTARMEDAIQVLKLIGVTLGLAATPTQWVAVIGVVAILVQCLIWLRFQRDFKGWREEMAKSNEANLVRIKLVEDVQERMADCHQKNHPADNIQGTILGLMRHKEGAK